MSKFKNWLWKKIFKHEVEEFAKLHEKIECQLHNKIENLKEQNDHLKLEITKLKLKGK